MSSPETSPTRSFPRKPQPACDRQHRLGAPARVDAAGVRGDPDATLDDVGQNPLHERHEVPRVAGGRIARLLLLHDGHRDFGEVVHHQVVDGSAAHLADRRLEPVAPEPLPRGDADGPAVAGRHGTSAVPGAESSISRVQLRSSARVTSSPSGTNLGPSGQGEAGSGKSPWRGVRRDALRAGVGTGQHDRCIGIDPDRGARGSTAGRPPSRQSRGRARASPGHRRGPRAAPPAAGRTS